METRQNLDELVARELACVIPEMARQKMRVFRYADKLKQRFILVERDGYGAIVQLNSELLSNHYLVLMPITPHRDYGSSVRLSQAEVPFGQGDGARLIRALDEALVPQAFCAITGTTHRNEGMPPTYSKYTNIEQLAGPDPAPEQPVDESTTSKVEPAVTPLGITAIIEPITQPASDWSYLLSGNDELVSIDEFTDGTALGKHTFRAETGSGGVLGDYGDWEGVRSETVSIIKDHCDEKNRPSMDFWRGLFAAQGLTVKDHQIILATSEYHTVLPIMHDLNTGAWLQVIEQIHQRITSRLDA